MKRHFWLILAVISLLGMIIMPKMAHSQQIRIPMTVPGISIPRVVLPTYPMPTVAINQPRIQLPAPRLNAGIAVYNLQAQVPAAPTTLVAVVKVVPVAAVAAAPAAVPASVIPLTDKRASEALRKLYEATKRKGKTPSPADISTLFDGAVQAEPIPVPVDVPPQGNDQGKAPEKTEPGDSRLTLPEWDLEQEIGIGAY